MTYSNWTRKTEILNIPLKNKKNESTIKALPMTKSPRADRFSAMLYNTFKENLILNFLKLFQEV